MTKTITILAIVAAFVVGTITMATVVSAQGDTINACVKNNSNGVNLRIVDSANDCKNNETSLDWNSSGINTIIAGFGLSGGGSSSSVTLDADPTVVQQRISGSCLAGESIRAINQDGTVVCEVDDVGAAATNATRIFTIAQDSVTVSPGARGIAIANCFPAVVTGGGYTISTDIQVDQSFGDSHSWRVSGINTGSVNGFIKSLAICGSP